MLPKVIWRDKDVKRYLCGDKAGVNTFDVSPYLISDSTFCGAVYGMTDKHEHL